MVTVVLSYDMSDKIDSSRGPSDVLGHSNDGNADGPTLSPYGSNREELNATNTGQ